MLLSVHYVEGIDIADRETWIGVFLIGKERSRALDAIANGADDVGIRVATSAVGLGKTLPFENAGFPSAAFDSLARSTTSNRSSIVRAFSRPERLTKGVSP